MSNESKWLTAIGGLVAAIAPLLVAYGIVSNDQAELWQNLVMAIAALIIPIAVTMIVRNYNDNEASLLVADKELEALRLRGE